ncbi:MAG: hypothetical protein L0Y39_11020 [Methylococcaceae bacterium]|nr:hypothetical protein [Methylococcaceae bacterium]
MDKVLAVISSHHRVPERFSDLAAELVIEPYSGEWLDTIKFKKKFHNTAAALEQGKWLRLSFSLRIANGLYESELYVFPVPHEPEMGGMQLNFNGRIYAAVYGNQPRVSGKFDERVKRGLGLVCYETAGAAEAESLILLPDAGKFISVSSAEVVERLRNPQMELHGCRAGVITGVDQRLLSIEELCQIWHVPSSDVRLITTLSGYTILDLLQPFTEPD